MPIFYIVYWILNCQTYWAKYRTLSMWLQEYTKNRIGLVYLNVQVLKYVQIYFTFIYSCILINVTTFRSTKSSSAQGFTHPDPDISNRVCVDVRPADSTAETETLISAVQAYILGWATRAKDS